MGKNSTHWRSFFYTTSNIAEKEISSPNNRKAENTLAMLEIHRIQLPPPPQLMNIEHEIPRPFQLQQPLNFQNSMTNGGLVVNPPRCNYQQQMAAPAQCIQAVGNKVLGSTVKNSQNLPKSDTIVGNSSRRRRNIVKSTEEAMELGMEKMIKKRASATKSRAKKLAQRIQEKENLKEMEEEKARIKELQAEAIRKRHKELEEEMKERRLTKAEKTAEKFRALRKTSSSSW